MLEVHSFKYIFSTLRFVYFLKSLIQGLVALAGFQSVLKIVSKSVLVALFFQLIHFVALGSCFINFSTKNFNED